MKRILAIGDGGAPTGFATVMHNVLSEMDTTKFAIEHLAINYKGDPHPFPWRIYPAHLGGDLLGMRRIESFKDDIDGIFILNDPWVLAKYLTVIKDIYKGKKIPPIVVYYPVDALELSPKWFKDFDIVTTPVVYTEFGYTETRKVYDREDIRIIPHGIDKQSFFKIPAPKEEVKKAIYPGDPKLWDSFIFLNANRNQPRKHVDITMEGFKLFSEGKPENVMLYLHMGIKDIGWDIEELAIKLDMDDRIILTSGERIIQGVSIQKLNYIYNATDAGINTCLGEGWSLTNMEHAVTGAVQIIPDHSALHELYKDCGVFIPVAEPVRTTEPLTVMGLVRKEDVAEKMQYVYDNRDKDLGEAGMKKFTDPKYEWKNICKNQWNPLFEEAFNDNNIYVADKSGQ